MPQHTSQPVLLQITQPGTSNMHTLAQSAQPQIIGAGPMIVGGAGNFVRGSRPPTPGINYLKPTTVQYKPQGNITPRHKPLGSQSPGNTVAAPNTGSIGPPVQVVAPQVVTPLPITNPGGQQFQRLKVEDALSYLDQVKYQFNSQPQVYNDFLDIMKEFKSQTIDTPGVITRVSNLFKGHTELIVGFNTFLPPGYKIEVQSNGQVSVSMPSPSSMSVSLHHAAPQQLLHILPAPQHAPTTPTAIVHNLSVNAPTPPANTLHHISQAHQQIEAGHHSQGNAQNAGNHAPAQPSQPVEFNHAIEYVNKIKSRFSRQPDKYKKFLEILHAYQRGHREVKDKQQTEQEVYSQVAKLFENQEDLLAEFGQFLPDAKASTPQLRASVEGDCEPSRFPPPVPLPPAPAVSPQHHLQIIKHSGPVAQVTPSQQSQHLKRMPAYSASLQSNAGPPPAKKARVAYSGSLRDVSFAEAAKYGTMQEYNFFDRVKHALKSPEIYDNFLKCLLLFTSEVISSSELVQMTAHFFCRHPELKRWLHDFVGPMSPPHTPTNTHGFNSYPPNANIMLAFDRDRNSSDVIKSERVRYEPLGPMGAQLRHDRPQGDAAMDVDLSTCKRLGTSYCALPKGSSESASRKCSGRTALCKEVLNDTWVSFPTWSEDSTFVTSRKTQYEEYIYRCEDERFELDVVIETNAATIRVLEGVQKKISRMTSEDAARFKLDDCLGGTSPTIHQRALRRIYGDKAVDIIAGLKKNPGVAVPVVLRRLKAKEEEWREAQKGFNKQWREQNEKYYLKSLDHQGINFKQNDLKTVRSKSLYNEILAAHSSSKAGPHVTVDYNTSSRAEAIKVVRDAAELLIHHTRRSTAMQKAEKRRIKRLLRHFLPDLFNHPRQALSDDEKDDDDKEESGSPRPPMADGDKEVGGTSNSVKQEKPETSESDNNSDKGSRNNNNKNNKENTPKNNIAMDNVKENSNSSSKRCSSNEDQKSDIKMEPEDEYHDVPPNSKRFVCSMSWYLFMRLHGVICQRLVAARLAACPPPAHGTNNSVRPHPSVALALRLRPNNLPPNVRSPADYYNALLELVKGVLDGNLESLSYEDLAREMLGIRAYPSYTLDKLVSNAVRQLQHCVSEPWSWRAIMLARSASATAGYVRRARKMLAGENGTFLLHIYSGNECRIEYTLLETGSEGRTSPNNENSRLSPTNQSRSGRGSESAVSRVAAWSLYSERYACNSRSMALASPQNKAVFLRRNARRCGGGAVVAAAANSHVQASTQSHARRKPLRLHDQQDAQLGQGLRLVLARPHHMYRGGSLLAARESHASLSASRRRRFNAWLTAHGHNGL